MDDDLSVPAALAVVHNTVGRGNTALVEGARDEEVRGLLAAVRGMAAILGVDPLDAHWSGTRDDYAPLAEALVDDLLEQRQQARAARDFAAADAIRARLVGLGVEIEDTPSGTRWSLRREV
jgi:cysteinyl-tRNA synthetase